MKFRDAPVDTILSVGYDAYAMKVAEPAKAESGMYTNALWLNAAGEKIGTTYIPDDQEVTIEVPDTGSSPAVADDVPAAPAPKRGTSKRSGG